MGFHVPDFPKSTSNYLLYLVIHKLYMSVKQLDPCFLTTLVRSKYLEVLMGKSGAYKSKLTLKPHFEAKYGAFNFNKRSQWPWIRVSSPTELKSSSPLP